MSRNLLDAVGSSSSLEERKENEAKQQMLHCNTPMCENVHLEYHSLIGLLTIDQCFIFCSDKNKKWFVQLLSYVTHVFIIINSFLNVTFSLFFLLFLYGGRKFPSYMALSTTRPLTYTRSFFFLFLSFLFLWFCDIYRRTTNV